MNTMISKWITTIVAASMANLVNPGSVGSYPNASRDRGIFLGAFFRGRGQRQAIFQFAPLARHHVDNTAKSSHGAESPTVEPRHAEPPQRPDGDGEAYAAPRQRNSERSDQPSRQLFHLLQHDCTRTPASALVGQ